VFLRPGDNRQPRIEKHLVPMPMLLKALGRVIRQRRKRVPVRRQELADLPLECQRLVVEIKIHYVISRSCGLSTLPPALRGSVSTNLTERGALKFAKYSRVYAITACSSRPDPGRLTRKARPTSPSRSSGTPITAQSNTPS